MSTSKSVLDYDKKTVLNGVFDKEETTKIEDPKKALKYNESRQKRLEAKIKRLEAQVKKAPKDWQAVVRLLLAKSDLVKQKQQTSTLQYQIEINKYRTAKKTKKKSSGDGSSGNAKLDKMVQ